MKLIHTVRILILTSTLKSSRWLHAKKSYETAGSLGLRNSLETLDHCEFRFQTFGWHSTILGHELTMAGVQQECK